MTEQTQQIPPSRRQRRAMLKQNGVLRALSKLSFFHPVKKQIREQNREAGRKIHQMHLDRIESMQSTFYEERLQSAKSTWFGIGYNKEEVAMLEEAWALTVIKDKETYREDKKRARQLQKQAADSLAARNTTK